MPEYDDVIARTTYSNVSNVVVVGGWRMEVVSIDDIIGPKQHT